MSPEECGISVEAMLAQEELKKVYEHNIGRELSYGELITVLKPLALHESVIKQFATHDIVIANGIKGKSITSYSLKSVHRAYLAYVAMKENGGKEINKRYGWNEIIRKVKMRIGYDTSIFEDEVGRKLIGKLKKLLDSEKARAKK